MTLAPMAKFRRVGGLDASVSVHYVSQVAADLGGEEESNAQAVRRPARARFACKTILAATRLEFSAPIYQKRLAFSMQPP